MDYKDFLKTKAIKFQSTGIGSEVYQAVKMGRRGVGIELKPGYFNVAVKNLKNLERHPKMDLFSFAAKQQNDSIELFQKKLGQ